MKGGNLWTLALFKSPLGDSNMFSAMRTISSVTDRDEHFLVGWMGRSSLIYFRKHLRSILQLRKLRLRDRGQLAQIWIINRQRSQSLNLTFLLENTKFFLCYPRERRTQRNNSARFWWREKGDGRGRQKGHPERHPKKRKKGRKICRMISTTVFKVCA